MNPFVPIEESPEFFATAPAVERTSERQRHILALLSNSGPAGATTKEAVAYLKSNLDSESHHGTASGALSDLHKDGRIARLAARRDRYHVYVLPEHVNDRPTEDHSSKKESGVLGTRKKMEFSERLEDSMEREKNLHIQIDELHQLLDQQKDQIARSADLADQLQAANASALEEAREWAAVELNRTKIEWAAQVDALRKEVRPRKVLTADEQELLKHVADLLSKYPTDGTKDSPIIIKARISTIRGLALAVARVVSE